MKLSQAQRRILVLLRDTGKLSMHTTPRQMSVLRKAGLIGFEKDPIRWFLTEEGREALTRKAPAKAPAQRKPKQFRQWGTKARSFEVRDQAPGPIGDPRKPKPRKPLKKLGKRGLAWKEIREKELKPAFKAAGITKCEANMEGCWGAKAPTFAHTKKRRFCTTPELMRRCALLCVPCHNVLEALSHEEMEHAIERIIAKRRVPVVLPTPKQ